MLNASLPNSHSVSLASSRVLKHRVVEYMLRETEMQVQQRRLLFVALSRQLCENELRTGFLGIANSVMFRVFPAPPPQHLGINRPNGVFSTCCPICTRMHGFSSHRVRGACDQRQSFSSKTGSDSPERESCSIVTTKSGGDSQDNEKGSTAVGERGGAADAAGAVSLRRVTSVLETASKEDLSALRYPKLEEAAARAASRIDAEMTAASAMSRQQQPTKPTLPPSSGTVLTWRVALLGSAVAMYG